MTKQVSAVRPDSYKKFWALILLAFIFIALYMTINVRFDHPKLFAYAMKQRSIKVIVMIVVAFAIGAASLVFQSIINNTIVTPCLLGMNSLYSFVHTAVAFFLGTGSVLARNSNLAFLADLLIMGNVSKLSYNVPLY